MATIDLGLLQKNQVPQMKNIPAPPPPPPKAERTVIAPPPPPKEEENSAFIVGREDEETFDKNEHKFEGANASILSGPTETYMAEEPEPVTNETKQETVNEEPIRVFVVGGNDKYYRNSLEPLNASTSDIKFVKYLPSDDMMTLMAIDALNPDIILVWMKTNMVDAVRFWNTICNGVDDNGESLRKKFANKRLIVAAPNDISAEIKLRDAGLSWIVHETNPQRHELNIDMLVETIRAAHDDILAKKGFSDEGIVDEPETNKEPVMNEPSLDEEPVMPRRELEEPAAQEPLEQEEHIQETQEEPIIAPPPVIQEEPPVKNESIPSQQKAPQIRQEVRRQAPRPVMQREAPRYEQPRQAEEHPIQSRMREMSNPPKEPSKVIGVYSITGGAGTTTCAANLAAILAKFSNKNVNSDVRVALIEYNFSCQCIDIFFNIKQKDKDLCALAKETERYINENGVIDIDSEKMKPIVSKYITHDDRSGLDMLFGLRIPPEFDYIHDGFTKSLFGALRGMYDYIIVDLSADMAKRPVLDALEEVDMVYYIMPMDVASIRNTQHIIPLFKSIFRLTPDQIRIILNKVIENNKEFNVEQVYDLFRKIECEPEGTIPYEAEDSMVSSMNRGVPISIENPEHPVSQALYSIAVGINPMLEMVNVGETDEKPEKKGFFSKLFGGGKKKKKKKDKKPESPVKRQHVRRESEEEQEDMDIPVKDEYTEMEEEEQPKKKKGGFFSGLFGGGKKKKKERPQKRRPEPEEEDNMADSSIEEEEQRPTKKKERTGLFAKLAGILSFGKKVGVKKNNRGGGILGMGKKKNQEPVDDYDDEPAPPPRPSRLQPRRRRPVRRAD